MARHPCCCIKIGGISGRVSFGPEATARDLRRRALSTLPLVQRCLENGDGGEILPPAWRGGAATKHLRGRVAAHDAWGDPQVPPSRSGRPSLASLPGHVPP